MEEGEVAESKRRGEDAADDEHLDGVLGDAVDDDAQDDVVDDDFDDDEPVAASGRRSSSAVKLKASDDSKVLKSANANPGFFERIVRFIREVVAELQKVNWPSRNELITYTSVVLVFVVVMMLIVAGLDWVFAWLVTHVFG
jgi:preprotein translocase subunit SecE